MPKDIGYRDHLSHDEQRDSSENEKDRGMSFERDVRVMQDLLEKENPEFFSTKWIMAHRTLYNRLYKKLKRTEARGIDWSRVIHLLDEKWQKRWKPYAERRLDRDIRLLQELLEREGPRTFGPKWIHNHDSALYSSLLRRVRSKDGKKDWSKITDSLDEEWHARWLYKQQGEKREHGLKGLEEDARLLLRLLEKENPKIVGPKWIAAHDPMMLRRLYKRLYEVARDGGDGLNWPLFVSMLGDKWQKRWKAKAFPEHEDFSEMYENEEEVEDLLERHGDKLYTFLSIQKPEDKAALNAICLDFTRLAQKGNVSAERQLVDLFMPLIQEWVDKKPGFEVYKHDMETAREAIKRCIQLHDAKRADSFVAYIYKTLQLRARGLRKQIAQSLDQPLHDGDGRTLYDTLLNKEP